jgi:DNA-binding transcriptional LysR family regulator
LHTFAHPSVAALTFKKGGPEKDTRHALINDASDIDPSSMTQARKITSQQTLHPRQSILGRLEMALNEIKLMEAAIALAEELNFSRAAQKLHISQPALTKRIAELEDRLGLALFERDRQIVDVNDPGRAFVEEARLLVLHGERAFQAARTVARGVDVVLNVGRSPYTDPFLVSTLLSIQLPLFPGLRVELTSQFSCDLINLLLEGTIDLAIATEPTESPLITTAKVNEAPFYIAMSEHDQLAACLANLRGVLPSKVQRVMVPEEVFPSVSEGLCVAFLVKVGALRMARNGVTVRPLTEDSLMLKTYMACRANNKSEAASELVRAFMRKLSHQGNEKQLSLPISA